MRKMLVLKLRVDVVESIPSTYCWTPVDDPQQTLLVESVHIKCLAAPTFKDWLEDTSEFASKVSVALVESLYITMVGAFIPSPATPTEKFLALEYRVADPGEVLDHFRFESEVVEPAPKTPATVDTKKLFPAASVVDLSTYKYPLASQ